MASTTRAFDYLFKVLLIGDSGVGKTSILNRYSENTFNTMFISTIGIDFKVKTIVLNGKNIKLQLWDTAGQERFRTITSAYYRGAMGIILVYDVTDEKSFRNIETWVTTLNSHTENVVLLIVGNKCDAQKRIITTEQGQSMATKFNALFFETSAKDDTNVTAAVLALATEIQKKLVRSVVVTPVITTVTIESPEKEKLTKKKSFCALL